MTLIKPDGNDGAAQDILRAAAQHFENTLTAFQRSTDKIMSGEDAPSPESEKLARLFSGATQVLFKEKQKIEDSNRKDAGIVYDFALDFASARDEIRGRLARIRDAANSGDISE